MDKPREPKSGQLLDDLKSIRDLLEKYQLEPPILTESADDDIPVLSEVIDNEQKPTPDVKPEPPVVQVTVPTASTVTPQPAPKPAPTPQRIDSELRKTAHLILQDVIDDFVPQIEAELRKRLQARLKDML
ncbi:DNA polymerase III subunit chi [Pseudomonas sp. Marseille-QA0892]